MGLAAFKLYPSGRQSHINCTRVAASRMKIVAAWPPVAYNMSGVFKIQNTLFFRTPYSVPNWLKFHGILCGIIGKFFAESHNYFHVRILYFYQGKHFKAPVVQTRSGVAKASAQVPLV
jgi:hypothetical protein